MKLWIVILAAVGLASGCKCEPVPCSQQEILSTPKELTMLFEGLVSYVQDADGDGVTVLLVDSRTDKGDGIPVHVPVVTFDSSNGLALNEVPWVLDGEDIEIKLDPPPATNHLVVDPNVWAWTGSMSQLTGGVSAIKPQILDMTNRTPNGIVARVRLEHGRLEVDPRPEATLNAAVTFRTAGGITHPSGYSTTRAALLLKYTVTANTKITINSHRFGQMSLNTPKRAFEPSAQRLRASVGNISAQAHGGTGVDHDFARLYDLVTPTPPNLFLPNFAIPPGVGTRVCMGGGG